MRSFSACLVLAVVAIAAPARAATVGASAGLYVAGTTLPAVKGEVHVEVRGAFADVVVTQTYKNDLDRGVEAVYVFPLPGDAAVRAMTIRSGDRTITAQIAPREEARRAYEDAVAQGVVGALTEEERANVFTQQVTGIAKGAEVVVELRFDCTIARWRDGWELALPLVVGPRYVPGVANGDPTRGTGTAPDTDEVDDASRVTPPVRGDSGGNPVTATIDLGDVEVDAVEVPSHDASIRRSKGRTVASIKDLRADHDLVVRWTSSDAGGARAITERTDDGGVIALAVEAPRPAADAKREARRWVLVLDVSGSIDGSALVLLRRAANALIDRVGEDRLAILGPAGGSLKWRRGDAGLALSRKTVDTTDASGGTSLGELIGGALAGDAGEDVAVVVISDGLVADDAAVAARVDGARARVHTIGVGSAPNRWLLSELARRGRGVTEVLGAGDDVDAAIGELVAAAAAPVVTPTIDWGGLAIRDVTPSVMPTLAAGGSLVISARLDRLADARVTVYMGDAALDVHVGEEAGSDDGLVARRWARARIDDLVNQGASAEVIAQLGLTHGLITPYTALVARGEETTVKGGVRTTIVVPVAMPAGMRWQSVFGPDGDVGETLYPTDAETTKDQTDSKDKAKEPRHEDVATGSGAGGSDSTSVDEDDDERPMPAAPTMDAGSNGGYYEAEEILLHGRSVQRRGWNGSVSFTTGLHVRDDDRGAAVGVAVGAGRTITPGFSVGVQARLQDAPSVDGGVDVDLYAGVRKFVMIGGMPLIAVDVGAGTGLDDPGLAWRLGLRLGWWRIAPVFGVDQTYVRDGSGWSPRTTVGGGLEWRF